MYSKCLGLMNSPVSFSSLVWTALFFSLSGAAQPTPKPAGTVIGWGFETIPPITNAVAVAAGAGGTHIVVLLNDGTVVAWGNNSFGQASPPASLTNAIQIAAGSLHSVAVRSDGTVVCWGRNYFGESSPPPDLRDVVSVSAGLVHSLALSADGTVTGWGNLTADGVSNCTAIASGVSYNLAIKRDGTVLGWGGVNQWGEASIPPGLSNVIAVAAGRMHSLAIQQGGNVVAWGNMGVGTPPPGLTNAIAIAAGMQNSFAILNDGRLLAWAPNAQMYFPVAQTNIIAVAAGDGVGAAITLQASITSEPADVTRSAGQDGSFSVSALSGSPLQYQWQFNGADISGATNATLVVSNVQAAKAGPYRVALVNSGGTLFSRDAVLTVNTSPPRLLTNLSNQSVIAGTDHMLIIRAIGSEPITYQWFFNGTNIANATNSTLLLQNVSEMDEGRYRVGVSNAYGGGLSREMLLTVNHRPVLTNALLGGLVRLSWSGFGTLQEAPSLTGTWSTASSQANPQNLATNATMKFYRIRDP
jgi:hypothetical protein